jgi:helix-turn-helix protein
MSEKELKELQDIKKLIILQLIAAGVKPVEIAEILGMKASNFSRDFHAHKPIQRLKKGEKNAEKE